MVRHYVKLGSPDLGRLPLPRVVAIPGFRIRERKLRRSRPQFKILTQRTSPKHVFWQIGPMDAVAAVGGLMDWFERLTGFRETTYEATRARLRVEGGRLKSLANGKSFGIGEL